MTQQIHTTSPSPVLHLPHINMARYGQPFAIIAVCCLILTWQSFKGRKAPKGSASWAQPKHIDAAKKRVKEDAINGHPLKPSFMCGNIPLVNIITSLITLGKPESGKTFGIQQNLIFQQLKAGLPLCLMDLQYPVQTSQVVSIAASFGYKPEDIYIFAPGEPESEVWNITEGVEGAAAQERAALMQDNAAREGAHRQEDQFFTPGVRLLLAGSMSLVRHIKNLDNLLGCRALFTFPDLLARLDEHREKLAKIDPWALALFDQYRASAGSPQTAASLAASALAFLSIYGDKTLAPAIVGKTSFPLRLEGKKLLVLGCRPSNRVTVAPLITALLSQVVDQNLIVDESGQAGRKDSLQIGIAEAFSVNYKRLVTDVNENRKYGIYFNVDCQNFSQVQEKFGPDKLRSLMTGFGAKVWFNPGELDSAKYLESVIGTEIISQRKTTYQTRGGSSSSYEEKERPLFSAARVLKMRKQEAIVFSDGIASPTESNIPWRTKVKVEPLYVEMCEWAKTQWPQVQKYFIDRSPQVPVDDILEITRQAAEEFLPPPMSDREKLDRDDAACRAEYEAAVFGSV